MNYITHLNQWLALVSVDDRLTPHHVSIYLSLFHYWNKHRFPDKISICRSEVMQVSKIGSSKTYYKCLHELHEYGYIQYYPYFNHIKGSVITINDLSDADMFSAPDVDELPDENDDDIQPESSKKICSSRVATQVDPKQKDYSNCSKNDPGASQVVTPLLLNNINLINDKQRERRTREKNELKDDSFKNQEKDTGKGNRFLARDFPSVCAQKSRSVSGFPSKVRLESKKYVPRGFSIPTLEQVKDFFSHHLSGNYLNGILDAESRLFEAEKFFNHYESNGWLLGGKVPMRNWKASCRSWAAKIPYFSRNELKRSNYNRLHVKPVLNYAKSL
jgi:hypothetical protein